MRWLLLAIVACGSAARPDPIDRAATWMAQFPSDDLRFDAAIGLAAIAKVHPTAPVDAAYARARAVADRDTDNPMRRAFDDGFRAPAVSWAVPAPGEPRVNVDRVLAEAFGCAEHPLRDATIAYITGPMRDGGGYQTTHGLWALVIAHDHGCLTADRFGALAAPLVEELRAAEPAAPGPGVLDVDLFAERLLMLELAGDRGADLGAWTRALAAAQNPDGSWGTADTEPYHQFHATMLSTWALAVKKP